MSAKPRGAAADGRNKYIRTLCKFNLHFCDNLHFFPLYQGRDHTGWVAAPFSTETRVWALPSRRIT